VNEGGNSTGLRALQRELSASAALWLTRVGYPGQDHAEMLSWLVGQKGKEGKKGAALPSSFFLSVPCSINRQTKGPEEPDSAELPRLNS